MGLLHVGHLLWGLFWSALRELGCFGVSAGALSLAHSLPPILSVLGVVAT